MLKQKQSYCDLLIVINSLVAEGCPQLALQLSEHWKKENFRIEILYLSETNPDLKEEFLALDIPIHFMNIGNDMKNDISGELTGIGIQISVQEKTRNIIKNIKY